METILTNEEIAIAKLCMVAVTSHIFINIIQTVDLHISAVNPPGGMRKI